MHLDKELKTAEERIEAVNQLIAETPPEKLTPQYLNYMSDYILFVNDKNQTKKERKNPDGGILTNNRLSTINKRETSFEQIVASLENGEDGLYTMIINDKNQIMDRKERITKKELDEIPHMREYYENTQRLNEKLKTARGRNRFIIKQQIIDTWKDMYQIKASHYGIGMSRKPTNYIKMMARLDIPDNQYIDENGMPADDAAISLFNPTHVSFLLSYYTILKQETIDDFMGDIHFLLLDLEDLCEDIFMEEYPVLWDLIIWKVDGRTNEYIAQEMEDKYGIHHNEQYFSTLWRQRIPKMIAEEAKKRWIVWYYTNEEYGQWKKCGRCGEIKLAHSLFFSKNTSSKDGFYSICKECRRKKNQ